MKKAIKSLLLDTTCRCCGRRMWTLNVHRRPTAEHLEAARRICEFCDSEGNHDDHG